MLAKRFQRKSYQKSYPAKQRFSKRRFRKRKSLRRKRWLLDVVLGMVFLGSLGYLLFFSSGFKVEDYIFVPTRKMSDWQFIVTLLKNQRGKSIFLVPSAFLEAKILERVPEIGSVKLKKILPHDLILDYSLREPVLLVCSQATSSDCCLVDEKAIIFGCQTLGWWEEKEMLQLVQTEEAINQEEVGKILEITGQLAKLTIEIKNLTLSGKSRLNVKTSESWEIYFDLERDVQLALSKLEVLLKKEVPPEERRNLEYIDLRFSKAYYK